jgi:hypothetical protein
MTAGHGHDVDGGESRVGHRKHGAVAGGDLGRIAEALATHSQRRDIMPIVMRRVTCLNHRGGAESGRVGVMRSVLIWTVIIVTLVLFRLSHAAEFSCAAGDVTCLRAVINTTIADNAANEGGGLANLGWGPVVLINATVARNSAGGIFGGGGIANLGSGTVELQNTILALNTAPGVLGPDCFGRIISRGHNLIGDTADCTIQRRANDLVGDPDLGDFADDGASGHVYFPLLPASRAIDAGDGAACPPTDQLGHPRFNVCDIGAVECTPPRCMRTSPSRHSR